ncbi:hypothetical protein GCM10010275_71870 [Streptomyces litmocidini]|nr:hypothetical protein GCM10010275_71870 [Streptomyces litmocidini]
MRRVHDWTHWCLYPGDDPHEAIPRIPRAVHAHATLRSLPGGAWSLAWAKPAAVGAVPVTAIRHQAAPTASVAVPDPDPDRDGRAAAWAR